MAALPYRAYAANVPSRGLAAVSTGEPQVCRRRAAGDVGTRGADCPGAGLSLCATASNGQGRAPRRTRDDFLAHSLAQPGSLRDLSVAAGTGGWPAWR